MEEMDYYLLKASELYYKDFRDAKVVFQVFTRKLPENYGYLVFAGLEDVINTILNFRFSEEYITYLDEQKEFSTEFLEYLRRFRFSGDILAMDEGTLFFQNEPVITVIGDPIESQILETFVLRTVRYQTLVATKTARMVSVANGVPIIDFSARGSPNPLASTRAAYIGGCVSTSNVQAALKYGIPVTGTMPHALIQMYGSDEKAFRAYKEKYPNQIALIDTFDIEKGLEEALKDGFSGIRLDSGGEKEIKCILKRLGNKKFLLSGDLDEYRIQKLDKYRFSGFGVGRKISYPLDKLDLVYKLKEVEIDGEKRLITKKSKGKGYYPGRIQVIREEQTDYLTYEEKGLLKRYIKNGKLVRRLPQLNKIRERVLSQLKELPEKFIRIINPDDYPVIPKEEVKEALRRLTC